MYDRILYPTDGSEGAAAALDHAIDHAVTYGASLHVLYVVEEPLQVEATAPEVFDALEEEGERIVEDVRDRAKESDVESIQASIAAGSPDRQIVRYVDDRDVDLIVMGTHGRSGLDRYLLGSVAEKVVRTAACPVLTVRPPEE